MLYCYTAAEATTADAKSVTLPVRVAAFKIRVTTFETIAKARQIKFLFRLLEQCVAPAELRLHAHRGCGCGIPAALVKIEVWFTVDEPANASILGTLASDHPALVRSLKVLAIARNAYDESAALAAFAALATRLEELTFWDCGLASVRGLEGRCEYLRVVNLRHCKQLTNVDALAGRLCLQEVDVGGTRLTSIEPLRTCPNLMKVDLWYCEQLSSIDALADHRRLEEVNAAYSGITSIEPLWSCPKLTNVDFHGCWQLPDGVRLPDTVRPW